jgi:multisubunit Na+/H+ antiporter MnhG subunit
MNWVKNVVLIMLLIGIASSLFASVYYGIIIKSSFTDWRYPTTIAFTSSCVTIVTSLSYLYLTQTKDNPSPKSPE